jgi:hypothetical protein
MTRTAALLVAASIVIVAFIALRARRPRRVEAVMPVADEPIDAGETGAVARWRERLVAAADSYVTAVERARDADPDWPGWPIALATAREAARRARIDTRAVVAARLRWLGVPERIDALAASAPDAAAAIRDAVDELRAAVDAPLFPSLPRLSLGGLA